MSHRSLLSVAVAGSWWNDLTYSYDGEPPAPGTRVKVPMGRAERVGVVISDGAEHDGEIRPITSVIDSEPIISRGTVRLLQWFADAHLCGLGTAAKTLLPAHFMKGSPIKGDVRIETPRAPDADDVHFVYEPRDRARFERYAEIVSSASTALICCPTHRSAKAIFDHVTERACVEDRAMLYPRGTAAAEWRAWGEIASGGKRVVVGSQSAMLAPMPSIGALIVEDESSAVWRTMRRPVFNGRSLLSMRARLEGARLVLGGRMPSARAFMRIDSSERPCTESRPPRSKKTFFVDLRMAYAPAVKGVEGTLAVSEPLVRETERALDRGMWAIWILDRKGYAGEIICDECGASLSCPKCGGAMRWEAGASLVRCVVCSQAGVVPGVCPNCGGRLLTARRPGLETLPSLARSALCGGTPIYLMGDADEDASMDAGVPGLMIGTRALLEELDSRAVGLVAWLDADGEARREEHGAKARAFGLIWESLWRGVDPDERCVLLQTRRPGRDWQKGLEDTAEGWRTFWRTELAERSDFSMPPYVPLVRIDASLADTERITRLMDEKYFEYWIAAPDGEEHRRRTVWARTKKLADLRRTLSPVFHISRASRGLPSVEVWLD